MATYKDQYNIISNNTVEIIPESELLSKLKKSSENCLPLNIKLGCDPSRPDLHIGHSVVLNKLKEFQDLGHNVVLVIGDFTAMIGDPTGRNKTRPQISLEETYANSKTYIKQVSKILNIEKTRIVYNSKWLNEINFTKVVELSSKFTVAQFLERDDFSKRYKSGKPISLHEFMYPLAQAYDSVYLRSDVEIGGTDQKFNLLLARSLQKEYDMSPQVTISMPLIEGTDGVEKMSKSYDNFVAFNDSPDNMYGKILSIPDELILKYFSLVVNAPANEIEDYKLMLKMNKIDNRDLKRKLARSIISIYYNKDMASKAELNFDKIFIKKDIPDNIPTYKLSSNMKLIDLIYESKLVESKSEIKRLIKQGAVKIDNTQVIDIHYVISNKNDAIIKVGKRRFVKAVI